MTVFKNYFKIVRNNLGFIIMYSAIAIGIAGVNTSYNSDNEYQSITSKVGIINYDNSKIIDNFIDYMDSETEIIEVSDDKKSIQDTLYDNKVDAILIIPDGYTENLLNGKSPQIEIKKSTQNMATTIELITNKYFKLIDIYNESGMSETEIINHVNENIKKEIEVKIFSKSKYLANMKLTIFYSYENYAFISIFIFIVCNIMCIFNKDTIKKRNSISKTSAVKISRSIFLGHLTLTLTIWMIFTIISILLYKDIMFSTPGILFGVNSLIFAITITSFAFLIGNIIENKNVISGIQNIVGLGTSFISGCFISPNLLDNSILNVSKIFPSYWYINSNYKIAELSEYTFNTLKPVINNTIVILAFCIAFLIASVVVIKRKSRNIL